LAEEDSFGTWKEKAGVFCAFQDEGTLCSYVIFRFLVVQVGLWHTLKLFSPQPVD